MSRYSNQQIFNAILNGEEEVLFYLTKKYFESSRRWLRRNGCRDSDTPAIFSNVLVSVWGEIQQNNFSPKVDFELFFFNSLREFFKNQKPDKNHNQESIESKQKEVIGSCFSILDESSRKILSARYAEKLSFEQIAVRLNFSNPVIAHFEFDRAFSQFEKIARTRLNVASE